jgi:hypothetical protein
MDKEGLSRKDKINSVYRHLSISSSLGNCWISSIASFLSM